MDTKIVAKERNLIMCGIAGVFLTEKNVEMPLTIAERMVGTMHHRGPDARGAWRGPGIILGHTRLSIIDLASTSNQPLEDPNSGNVLVYNGEIYNYLELREELLNKGYSFRTHGDAEVILKSYLEWGEKCLEKFIGMWAFALYDPRKDQLFLARDRFGIKPLLYSKVQGGVVFASEFRAILASQMVRTDLNLRTIYNYLSDSEVDTEESTFYEQIKNMPAGCFAFIRRQNPLEFEFQKYWDPYRIQPTDKETPYRDSVEEFRELIRNAVNIHMRSDVPVGVCLSGGLDSSTIACIAAEKMHLANNDLHTFSAVFPDTYYDEQKYVHSVVEYKGLIGHNITPTEGEFANEIDGLIAAQEVPFGSTGVYVQWKVFEAANNYGMKVMLDGQGADEALAGYLSFYLPYVYEELKNFHLQNALHTIYLYLRYNKKKHYIFRNLLSFFRRLTGNKNFDKIPFWMSPEFGAFNQQNFHAASDQTRSDFRLTVGDMVRRYLTSHSLPSLLRYEDKNSMHHSIESRVPFLDHRIVEYALKLQTRALIYKGTTKRILRDSMIGIVPSTVINRRDKLGFANPEGSWIKNIVKPRLLDTMGDPAIKEFFSVSSLNRIFKNEAEFENYAALLWRIYNLTQWLRMQTVSNLSLNNMGRPA